MKVRRSIAGLALLAACSEPQTAWLPSEGAESVILAVEREGAVDLTAFALSADQASNLTVDLEPDRVVYALRYGRSLDSMRLHAGRLKVVSRGLDLPDPELPLLQLPIQDGRAGEWTEAGELPAEIANSKLEAGARCVRFISRPFDFPDTYEDGPAFAIALDPMTALVSSVKGKFFRVTAGGPELAGDFNDVPHLSAARDPASGELWTAAVGGAVSRGTLEDGFTPIEPIPTASTSYVYLAGGSGAGGFELYAVTTALELWKLSGSRWSQVDRRPLLSRENSEMRVAWFGPGKVLATGYGNERLLVHENGETRVDTVPLPFQIGSDDAFEGAGVIEGFGAVAGSRYGLLFSRDETNAWRMFPQPAPTDGDVYVLHALDGGIIFGGQDGLVTQYFDGLGYCDAQSYASYDLVHLVPIGDGFMAVERGYEKTPMRATMLIRER